MGTELTPANPVPAVPYELDDLPALTDREYVFFTKILAGESPIDAYKAAYDCTDWHVGRIMKRALLLLEEPRMVACIQAGRFHGLSPTDLSKAAHLRQLEKQREMALSSLNHGAALNAEVARGKVAGLYVERHEHVQTFDPLRIIRELAKISEALARSQAEKYNIPWEQVIGEATAPSPAPVTVSREAEDAEFYDEPAGDDD